MRQSSPGMPARQQATSGLAPSVFLGACSARRPPPTGHARRLATRANSCWVWRHGSGEAVKDEDDDIVAVESHLTRFTIFLISGSGDDGRKHPGFGHGGYSEEQSSVGGAHSRSLAQPSPSPCAPAPAPLLSLLHGFHRIISCHLLWFVKGYGGIGCQPGIKQNGEPSGVSRAVTFPVFFVLAYGCYLTHIILEVLLTS